MLKPLLPITTLLLFTLAAIISCTGATPAPDPTETLAPTGVAAVTPLIANTPTPEATATPTPTPAATSILGGDCGQSEGEKGGRRAVQWGLNPSSPDWRIKVAAVKVIIGVGDPQGQRFEDLEVAVTDDGRTFTEVPRGLLGRMEVPVEKTILAEKDDGSTIRVDVGRTVIRVEGQEFPTPVIFGDDDEPGVLGTVSLSGAFLQVDPGTGHLVPIKVSRISRCILPEDSGRTTGE